MNCKTGNSNVVIRACHRSKLEDSSKMFNYLMISIILGCLVQSSIGENQLNHSARTIQANREVPESYGFLYNGWHKDDIALDENKISNFRISNSHKSQYDYVCGRAIANKKYKELMRDKDYQMSVARTKYRPIEIRMPRIIGGDETAPGEFPWAVSVKLNGQPICGGSLIDKSWILTAAHCVVGYNPKNLTVRLGAYRIKDISETQTLDLPVGMFIVHKDYSMPRPFSNDIALLKLDDPVEFTDFIIPICLPTEDQVTTSTSSVTINDYSNRYENGKNADFSGIVVSTKMSDNDIAKCFARLEQNYFNSIGLGAIADSATEQAPNASPNSGSNQLFSHDSLFEPVFMSTNSNNHHSYHNKFPSMSHHQKPAVQHFEPAPGAETNSFNSFGHQNNYVYYDLPWDRSSREKSESLNDFRRDAVKFSRLPISKELLREIQSIGSGPMPSLNLGLQQDDFISMASDLTQGSGNGNNHFGSTGGREKLITNADLFKNPANDDSDDPTKYSGLSGIVVGWGWVRELDGEDQNQGNKVYPSVTLQKVKLPILGNNVCEAWFQSQAKKITLLPSQFCAGFNSGGKDACRVSYKRMPSDRSIRLLSLLRVPNTNLSHICRYSGRFRRAYGDRGQLR